MDSGKTSKYASTLIKTKGAYYVPVSHLELDGLIGRLMHLCELMGDNVQREAMKSEIKLRTRSWLDSEYNRAGYDVFNGPDNDALVVTID